MMNCEKHLTITITNIILFSVILATAGCSKENSKKDFIARVNETYLTREDFASLVDAPLSGKKRSGSTPRQLARVCHLPGSLEVCSASISIMLSPSFSLLFRITNVKLQTCNFAVFLPPNARGKGTLS